MRKYAGFELTQEPYPCGAGSDSNYCAAHAVNATGKEAMIYWRIDRPEQPELADIVSDWNRPDYIEILN